jgi:hypothetical protein
MQGSSLVNHPSCHIFLLPAGKNSEKSSGTSAKQPDETKNFLDAKPINLLQTE